MRASLDCLSCIVRQSVEALRTISSDTSFHELLMREVLGWLQGAAFDVPPPVLVRHIHKRLHEATGNGDMYKAAKEKQNALALRLLPEMRKEVLASPDPLIAAARVAIAGNVIDMGVNGILDDAVIRNAIRKALSTPFWGDTEGFKRAVSHADSILYLTDNAGEIIFDRLLIELLPAGRVTVAVRGGAVLNDALLSDAREAGLHEIAKVMDNGTNIAGTVLEECSEEFRKTFSAADLIISKGQGNFETLNEASSDIFFLFCVKCQVIQTIVGQPVGTQVLISSSVKA